MLIKVRSHSTPTKLESIPGGNAGVRATLKRMAQLVNEGKKNYEIRALTLSLVKHLPAKNWLAEVQAIFSYVKNNIRYVRDIDGIETIATPEKTLEIGQGDCDDSAVLIATMLQSIGHPARFIAAGFNGNGLSHVYVETLIGNRWIPLEVTEDLRLGEFPKNITQTMMQHLNLKR